MNKHLKKIDLILKKKYDHETPDVPRSKEFNRAFRSMVRSALNGTPFELHSGSGGSQYCYCHGFIIHKPTGRSFYFSTNDFRSYEPLRMIIRETKGIKDYSGGPAVAVILSAFVRSLAYFVGDNPLDYPIDAIASI